MANKGLWLKELSAGKFKFLLATVILSAIAVFIPVIYDYVLNITKNVPAPIPRFAQEQAKMMGNYEYYIWYSWFGKNLYQFGAMLALIFGAGLISSEVSRRTIQFILTKPISRCDAFFIKYIAGLVSLILAILISTLVLYFTVLFMGHNVPLLKMLENLIVFSTGIALIYSVAVYFSTVFDQTAKSFLVSLAILLLVSIPGYFNNFESYSLFFYMAGAEVFNNEGFPYIAFSVLPALTVVVYKLGRNRFSKSDF